MTICTKCNKEKGTDFRKHRFVCRECDNQIAREKRLADKERAESEKPEFIICKKCGEKKTNFRFNRRTCYDCERVHGRNYRRTTDTAKIWVQNNREKMSELQSNWYKKSKPKIREERKERLKNDPKFKEGLYHRIAVNQLIKEYRYDSKYLNCDSVRLRSWLSFQFEPNMNIENYVKCWTVDHVIPIDKFLKDQVDKKIVFHYLNISPVLGKNNLYKNKYVTVQDCIDHLIRVKAFLEIKKIKDDTYVLGLEKFIEKLQNNPELGKIENNVMQNNLDAGTALESEDTTQEYNEAEEEEDTQEEQPQQYAKLVFIDDDGNEF